MLKTRVLTALILAPAVLGILFFAPLQIFALAISAITLLAAWEWSNFFATRVGVRAAYLALVAALIAPLYLLDMQAVLQPILFFASFFWLFALINVLGYPRNKTLRPAWAKAVVGLAVLIPACMALIGLRLDSEGRALTAFLFLLVWGADVGAYFSGKRFGTRKLLPAVSPGKTVEGVLGGVAVCALVALCFALVQGLSLAQGLGVVLLAVLVGLVSVLGDLFESLFKRERGVKDSGSILPGHGGILDRIDSLSAAAPVFLLGLTLLQI